MRLILVGFASALILLVLSAGSEGCSVRISELQLTSKEDRDEFVELTTDCQLPVSLSSYTMVLWTLKGKSVEVTQIHDIGNFSGTACEKMNNSVMVIGSASVKSKVSNQTDFCEFSVFGASWPLMNDHYLEKGDGSVNTLVIYQNLSSSDLKMNQTLTNISAHMDKIVDVLFYSKTGRGKDLYKFFIPEYNVHQRGFNTMFFILKDVDYGNVTSENRHSFSFCCNHSDSATLKWPMGYKWSMPSPGDAENNCNNSFNYSLDPLGQSYPLSMDRCDVKNITNYYPGPSTPSPIPGPTDAPHCDGMWKLGLGLGIPLGLIVLLGLSFLLVVVIRKRKYEALPGDQQCFPLNCFSSNSDPDRQLIIAD